MNKDKINAWLRDIFRFNDMDWVQGFLICGAGGGMMASSTIVGGLFLFLAGLIMMIKARSE